MQDRTTYEKSSKTCDPVRITGFLIPYRKCGILYFVRRLLDSVLLFETLSYGLYDVWSKA